jgi:hypothetical protein
LELCFDRDGKEFWGIINLIGLRSHESRGCCCLKVLEICFEFESEFEEP